MTNQSFFQPITETAADGKVAEIFSDIYKNLATKHVPVFFRIIAQLPMYLDTTWRRYKFAYLDHTLLDRRSKLMIGLAISASNNSRPLILDLTNRLKNEGMSEAEIAELMAVVDVTNGLNKTLKAMQIHEIVE